MVFGRVWNFVKRHKKKLIFSTIVVGGSYVAWNVLLPKLQDHLMNMMLAKLAGGGDSAESMEAKRRERFEHKQQVADAHARKKLAALRAKQNANFREEACTARIKEAQGKEAKLEAFKAFQVECLAKAVSALYLLHLSLVLHRIGFNIAGRELGTASGDDEAHAAFLQTLDNLEECSARIADAIRKVVRECIVETSVAPTTLVGQMTLEKLLTKASREANKELLAGSKASALLLPDEVNERPPKAQQKAVKRLLDEARDYLDSPQFLQVFEVATTRGATQMSRGLEQEITQAVGGDGPWPMAKFFGPLTKLAGLCLDDSDGDYSAKDFSRRFAEEPRLAEFCEGLFFQDARA